MSKTERPQKGGSYIRKSTGRLERQEHTQPAAPEKPATQTGAEAASADENKPAVKPAAKKEA